DGIRDFHVTGVQTCALPIYYLECGNIYLNLNSIDYTVYKIEDLIFKIVPFFDKYNIIGIKNKDYLLFKEVIQLIKNKEHLTDERSEERRVGKEYRCRIMT